MKKSSIIRSVVAVMAAAVLATTAMFGTVACSKDEGPIIQGQVDAALDGLKTVDDSTIEEVMGDSFVSEMSTYGVSATDIYRALVQHFEYKDNGVKVDGDSATVSLTTTNVDVTSVMSSWQEEFTAFAQTDDAITLYTSEGQNGLIKKALDMLVANLSADDAPTVTADVTVDLTKDSDGDWGVKDESQLVTALFAGEDISSLGSTL